MKQIGEILETKLFKCSCGFEWTLWMDKDKTNVEPDKSYFLKHKCKYLEVYQKIKGLRRIYKKIVEN